MNSNADSKLDTFILLQTAIEVSHSSNNSQTSPYCSLGVIFMGLGIAEVDQETIAKVLGDMPIEALNNFRTHLLICPYHVTPVFRVELGCQLRRFHQITENHGQLPSFRVGRRRGSNARCDLRGWLCLHNG